MSTGAFTLPLQERRNRLMILTGATLIIVALALMIYQLQIQFSKSSDFTQDYAAAQSLRAGQSIYRDFAAAPIRAADNPGRLLFDLPFAAPPGSIQNFHPPFNALLFAPFTLLPYPTALALWTFLSLLLYLATGFIVLQQLAIRLSFPAAVLLVGMALCWYPFQQHIYLGQISLLLIICIIGCWALLRQGRPLLAGLTLGLACLIKLFPGLLVAYLLLIGFRNVLRSRSPRRSLLASGLQEPHWQAAAAAILTLAVGGALVLLIIGQDDILRYIMEVAPQDLRMYGGSLLNFSVTGAVNRLLAETLWVRPLVVAPRFAWLLISLINLVTSGMLMYTVWRLQPDQRGNDGGFAIVCLAMLLLSPLTWADVFPVLALPFGLLLRDIRERRDRGLIGWSLVALALAAFPAFLIAGLLRVLYRPEQIPWYSALVLMIPTAMLVLLWWLIARTAKEQPLPAHDQPHSAVSR